MPQLNPLASTIGGRNPALLPLADWIDAVNLAAATAKWYTLPLDADGNPARVLRISSDAALKGGQVEEPIYLSWRGPAALPGAGDTLDGPGSLNLGTHVAPRALVVLPTGVAAISMICNVAAAVTVECWT
jgi:hypothetical protein